MINYKLAKNYKTKIQYLLKNLDTKKINNLCEIIKETSSFSEKFGADLF